MHVCAAYYRGAMGIVVVYDVTDEASFNNIRNWMRNIEQHASETNSNKARVSQAPLKRCIPDLCTMLWVLFEAFLLIGCCEVVRGT